MGGVASPLPLAAFLLHGAPCELQFPLAVFGLALVGGGKGLGIGNPFGSAHKSPGQASRVHTDRLRDGTRPRFRPHGWEGTDRAVRGPRAVGSLSDRETFELLDELQTEGAQEAPLIEAYLDWRLPGWRDQGEEKTAKEEAPRGHARASRMSAEEAYAVLGLENSASEDDIRQAHRRRLMMKMHPDQGGSTYLAARINEAKEVLLGRR